MAGGVARMRHVSRSDMDAVMLLMGYKLQIRNGLFSIHTLQVKHQFKVVGIKQVKVYSRSSVVRFQDPPDHPGGIRTKTLFTGTHDEVLDWLAEERNREKEYVG